MNEPHWISRETCLVLHEMMLLRYGGVAGLRDSPALDAILAAPKAGFAAGVTRIPDLAACYGVGIVLQQPFQSGNLASGFLILATFAGWNGFKFRGQGLGAVQMVLELAQGQQSAAEFAHYLRCTCRAEGGG